MTTLAKLSDPGAVDSLTARLNALSPGSERQPTTSPLPQVWPKRKQSFVAGGETPFEARWLTPTWWRAIVWVAWRGFSRG